jgi:hypothetical protein
MFTRRIFPALKIARHRRLRTQETATRRSDHLVEAFDNFDDAFAMRKPCDQTVSFRCVVSSVSPSPIKVR